MKIFIACVVFVGALNLSGATIAKSCPASIGYISESKDWLVSSRESAIKLAKVYEEFFNSPEKNIINVKHRSTIETKIEVHKLKYSWNIIIKSKRAIYPVIWGKFMEMNICSADGRLRSVKIHM